MDDKQKPFPTIYMRKPRNSRFVPVILILLIVAIAWGIGWHEHEGWQTKLLETEQHLQESTSKLIEAEYSLQVVETQLQEAMSKLEEYLLFWRQLDEPLGLRVWPEPQIKVTAITCVHVPEDYRQSASVYDTGYLFHYEILGPNTINKLIRDDKYKLVGKDNWSADWTYNDDVNDDYYMHEDVLRIFPYRWSSSKDWIDNRLDWEDRLQRYCKNTVNF